VCHGPAEQLADLRRLFAGAGELGPAVAGGVIVATNVDRQRAIVRAVVMSGYTDSKVMANPQSAGFAGVLPKPFTTADLFRVIESLRP
jgi:CheY-like chemotaxis protein